jgi:hypothetical protein
VYCWVLNFGVRDAFTRRLVFATLLLTVVRGRGRGRT